MYLNHCNLSGVHGVIFKNIAAIGPIHLEPNLATGSGGPPVISLCDDCLTLELCSYAGRGGETGFEI